jgi:hypothetical protein
MTPPRPNESAARWLVALAASLLLLTVAAAL